MSFLVMKLISLYRQKTGVAFHPKKAVIRG